MPTFMTNPNFGVPPAGAMARGYGEPGGRAAMAVNTNRMLGMMNNLGYGVDQDAIMASMFPNFRQPPQNIGVAMPGQYGAPGGGPDIGAPVGPVATTPDAGLNTAPQRRRIGAPANPVEAMGGAPQVNQFAQSGASKLQAQKRKKKNNQQGTSMPVTTVAY